MTKQEYEAKVLSLRGTHDYNMLCFIRGEYIASLEAENAALERKKEQLLEIDYQRVEVVRKLEKLNSAALERLSEHACPPYLLNYGQPCNDSNDCVACWREYLMKEGEDENQD